MFLFILEEAVQSIGMSVYLAYKAESCEDVRNLAQYAIDELIDPALDWIHTYGNLCYPNNLSYEEFFLASKKNMENYLKLCK